MEASRPVATEAGLSQSGQSGLDRCEDHRKVEVGIGRVRNRGLSTTWCRRQEFFKSQCHFFAPFYFEPKMRGRKKSWKCHEEVMKASRESHLLYAAPNTASVRFVATC